MFAGGHSVFVGNICAPPVGIGGDMSTLDSNHRYFVCRQPVNMRKGIDALFNLIQSESPPPVPDDRGRLRVLLQEQAERESSVLGHGRLPPLLEASGERLV